jgi:predicted TIM-barrel fold metal-dependent hydrolase
MIDIHTHLFPRGCMSDEFVSEAALMRKDTDISMDTLPEQHWAAMQGVERAVVLAMRFFHVGVNVSNDLVASYVREHAERLVGFMSLDPSEEDPIAEMERAYFDLEMRGIKMSPIYQNYHPSDPRAREIYARAEKLGLPMLLHQGATFPRRAPLKYALPHLLEDVALEFPELRIVIAHLGHPWEHETIVLIRKQPNVYADLSGLFYRPWQFYNSMMLAQEYNVQHKLLFGSDWPIATPEETARGIRNVNSVVEGTNLPRISPAALEEILSRDGLRCLGIS